MSTYFGPDLRLDESIADPDPLVQFAAWLEAAQAAPAEKEPTAMALATVDARCRPACRMVLLKAFDAAGFVFYTSYESDKAAHLAANPRAALTFFWASLYRSVRIEGVVSRVSREEADEYFRSRPYGSRIAAAASPQSRPIESRAVLEAWVAELEARYPEDVPLPDHWGGYRLAPDSIEFWQGRVYRLHDRLRYRRRRPAGSGPEAAGPEGWTIERLAP